MSDRLPEPVLFCESLFTPTSYKDLSEVLYGGAPEKPTIVDFTYTHITVLRLTDPKSSPLPKAKAYFTRPTRHLPHRSNAASEWPSPPHALRS